MPTPQDVEAHAASLGAHIPILGSRLNGKVALIAGAGCDPDKLMGTGATMSVLFAAQGAKVGVVDVSPERAAQTMLQVERTGGEAIPIIADIRDRKACEAAVATLAERFGGPNVLVNNAGVGRGGAIDKITDEDWDFTFDVNLRAVMHMSAAALPHLKGCGSVINVSSIAGQIGMGPIPYSTSKGGVIAMTRAMARELGPDNIRVNCLVPGHVIAPMMRTDPEYRRDLLDRLMLGYQGTAWDVAWAAVYLASEESRWITAEILQVDGGSPVSGPMPKGDPARPQAGSRRGQNQPT